ncbi:hypothetical protein AB6A40_009037 [Gnathostoma spinigerum]|uniref:RRM domain-containing protein n=1 Tax=Gnathostoma spinigerum TaxID=75299 RepID=A0ABD6EQV0_9BILA
MDSSLDDLIQRQKKKKGSLPGSGVSKMRSDWISNEHVPLNSNSKNYGQFTRASAVPEGKWGHDGFEELYGYNVSRPKAAVRAGGQFFGRGAINRNVQLHITNLAPTVSSDDLSELFEEYPVDSITMNYDETGHSTGTADILVDRASAEEIKANYSGAALDDRTMKIFIIDDDSTDVDGASVKRVTDRLSYPNRGQRLTRSLNQRGFRRSGGISKPYTNDLRRNFKKNVRRPNNPRQLMTVDDLDRELEEYMKKSSVANKMSSLNKNQTSLTSKEVAAVQMES